MKNLSLFLTRFYFFILFFTLTGCGAYFNQPFDKQPARIGEESQTSDLLTNLPPALQKAEVAVYNFSDQTGQYKPVENGSTFSTAVTQGATTILIKALGDSGWFVPIERENLSNLSTERNIIRNTKKEYVKGLNPNEPPLPPLLYAGLLLEGGIISYDTNIVTGGAGVRYFGVGGSTKYRQDRITVYLRAVSSSNGEILKTIYVSKTILSQAVDVNLFRFVKFQRLLEAETGFTSSEPVQLAVKDAIEKAVYNLIVEGIRDGFWGSKQGFEADKALVEAYNKETQIADNLQLHNRLNYSRRSKNVLNFSIGTTYNNNDYINPSVEFNAKATYKRYLNKNFNLNGSFNKFNLSNKNIYNEGFMSFDGNIEFTVLPEDRLSPFVFAGGGANVSNFFKRVDPKIQYGLGLEYLVTDKIGLTAYAENNHLFTDNIEGISRGNKDDSFFRFGFGINIYLGENDSPYAKKRQKRRQLKTKNKTNTNKRSLKN